MQSVLEEWLVEVAVHSPGPIDKSRIRQLLEQSDLGGDIVRFIDAPSTISLAVAAAGQSEQNAYCRVVARVKDALGSHWTVECEPSILKQSGTRAAR